MAEQPIPPFVQVQQVTDADGQPAFQILSNIDEKHPQAWSIIANLLLAGLRAAITQEMTVAREHQQARIQVAQSFPDFSAGHLKL